MFMNDSLYEAYVYAFDFIVLGYVPKCGRPGEQPNAYPQSLDISSAAKSLMNKLFIDTDHRLDYQQIWIQALHDKIDLDNIRNDRLEEKCNRLEASDSSLRFIVDQQNLSLEHKKEMIEKLELESQTYQRELKRLSKQVEVLVEERAATESKTEHLSGEINDKQTEAELIVENLHQQQLEELQGVIVQLEEEKMVSIRKLAGRDKQITSYREQLETSQKQAANLQLILDEERIKSRDDQKRNLVLLETREVQVEDKNAEISDLKKRILELGDKIEQQEREKANFERKEEDLKEIIEELEDKIEQQEREKANFERKEEDLKEIIEELGDKIEQQEREKANFERKEEDLKEFIEELGDKIEQQEREKANFERKEEDLKEIIEELGDKIEQQEREKANFERKEEDLKEIIEELGDKIEQQEREKANFERKEEDLKEFIEELGDKIEQQEREKANFERKEEDLKEIIEVVN
ncbi:trichohyalin-like [Ruditapes philippinarum]|uniref:trichohyalin-like n=1 Tax=Ruditapes philippinarum TaxID=129788 RepID=UPI00295A9212|nr:trichohyalin-like [Ruditapes philippinarum]